MNRDQQIVSGKDNASQPGVETTPGAEKDPGVENVAELATVSQDPPSTEPGPISENQDRFSQGRVINEDGMFAPRANSRKKQAADQFRSGLSAPRSASKQDGTHVLAPLRPRSHGPVHHHHHHPKGSEINPEPELEREEKLGGRCEVRTLYKQPADTCNCCSMWSHLPPPSLKVVQSLEMTTPDTTKKLDDAFAIVDRQDVHGSVLRPISIGINSTRLKDLISTAFEGYPAIDLQQRRLLFSSPFAPFVHRWDSLQQIRQDAEDQDDRRLLDLLLQTLGNKISPALFALEDYQKSGYVGWSDLSFILTPGEIVVRKHNNIYTAGRLRRVRQIKNSSLHYYSLDVDVVDWNGQTSGYHQNSWALPYFEETKLVRSMDIFPRTALLEEDQTRLKIMLIERGKRFEGLRGIYHRHFGEETQADAALHREAVKLRGSSGRKSSLVDGRVMIDAHAYYLFQGMTPPTLASLNNEEPAASLFPDLNALDTDEDDDLLSLDRNRLPNQSSSNFHCTPQRPHRPSPGTLLDPDENADSQRNQSEVNMEPLTDEQRMLTVPYVKGYSLVKKIWCQLGVDKIRPISWRANAFENLVLSPEEKELLLALVDVKQGSHGGDGASEFDDFIDGKVQGIILLLSGPPGVGKTLTAESISEHLELLLYRMGAGEVGQTASALTQALQTVLDLCTPWNAVLLMDEADVFLEQRSTDQLQRNELVSVFLTLLEYYRGVLVLTTNRATNLDSAFESRIDVLLNYKALDQDARATVWHNFLQTLPAHAVAVSPAEVKQLASRELNGRQIKSAVKTARILAARRKEPLGLRHLEVVLGIRERGVDLLRRAEGRV